MNEHMPFCLTSVSFPGRLISLLIRTLAERRRHWWLTEKETGKVAGVIELVKETLANIHLRHQDIFSIYEMVYDIPIK